MKKKEFNNLVVMAVEVEYEDGGRVWRTMSGDEVKAFCDKVRKSSDKFISDIDYCAEQCDDVQKVLDEAYKMFRENSAFKSLEAAINYLLEDDAPAKPRRVWTEEEIKVLVQTNDKVLYGALRNLYACQTADEKVDGAAHHCNGAGFNGVDAPILTSFAEFLNRTGFLTPKQRVLCRKKLIKYNKQLTILANSAN